MVLLALSQPLKHRPSAPVRAYNRIVHPRFTLSRHKTTPASAGTSIVYEVEDLPEKQAMSAASPDYSTWTNEQLLQRVSELESQLREQNESFKTKKTPKARPEADGVQPVRHTRANRKFDPERYHTRFIALKLAYLGQRYNGFEYHANNKTSLPTVEEEIWKALSKTRLILPESDKFMDWVGSEYSKCGRTDKGVSAFGQVIALRVRSSRPKTQPADSHDETSGKDGIEALQPAFDPVMDELEYPRLLNRVLPDDIRVLAWCPSPPPQFSARFSCRERRYRYFFTQPAYLPLSGNAGLEHRRLGSIERDGWLDIAAMQQAAQLFVGEHDFRNFCKVDPGKQLTNFSRRIFTSTIEEWGALSAIPAFLQHPSFGPHDTTSPSNTPKVYSFTVHGSAFLWHQIRHMIAILFLVGQGLEKPSVVTDLLNTGENKRKPLYEMADDAPLVLWDCIFPTADSPERVDSLGWIYPDRSSASKKTLPEVAFYGDGRFGAGGINETLWNLWRRTKIDELLAGSLLDIVAAQRLTPGESGFDESFTPPTSRANKIFDGGNTARLKGTYVPILQREQQDEVEVLNSRYLERTSSRLASEQKDNPTAARETS